MDLLSAAGSAPVTQWGPRVLLTLAVLALLGLGLWGMRRGWAARAARQGHIPAPPEPPGDLALDEGVAGMYVATTIAGDLLDRVVVHGLGARGRAMLHVAPEGLCLKRTGEQPVWIAREALRGVRLGSGQAQKAYEAGGLILVRWQLGDVEVETGFRADDPDQHVASAQHLSELAGRGGTR